MSATSSVFCKISVKKLLKEAKTDGLKFLILSKRSLNLSRIKV